MVSNYRMTVVLLVMMVLALANWACCGTTPSPGDLPAAETTDPEDAAADPTATSPSPGPTVDVSDCTLGAVFAADVTIPDNTPIDAGESFVKTWSVRNTGTCDWGPGYLLTFVDGDQMGGPQAVSVPKTATGETAEVSVQLIAPAEAGTYRGNWQMCVNETECFGDRFYVQIASRPIPIPPDAEAPEATEVPIPEPALVTTAEGEEISVPGVAFMDGRDLEAEPPLTVMIINIWDAVPREKVVCKLDHGVEVTVLDVHWLDDEGRYYFKVKRGDCEGWVSEPFLSTEYHEKEGDEFP